MCHSPLGVTTFQLTVSVLLIIWVQLIASDLGDGEELVVIVLLPLTGKVGHIGQSAKLDIEETVHQVNSNRSVLDGYSLVVKWVDTKCDMATTSKAVFDKLSQGDNIVFVYGGFCSSVTKPVAESMLHFNLWQVSFSNTDPTLSDVAAYNNFLRVIPNDLDFNVLAVHLLQFYEWNRVALLFQDATSGSDIYAYTNSDMISLLKGRGINYTSDSVEEGSSAALQTIIDNDNRIIIANIDYRMAQRSVCQGHRMGMYGYKYVWLFPHASTFPSEWWKNTTDCTADEMVQALQGHFNMEILATSHSQPQPLGTYSIAEDVTVPLSSQYSSYARDGVWLMALSLDSFIQSYHSSRWSRSTNRTTDWPHHTNQTSNWLKQTNHSTDWPKQNTNVPDWSRWRQLTDPSFMTDIEFQGNSGMVKFAGRRRLGSLLLNQWRDGEYMNVGQLDMNTEDNITLYTDRIWWHGRDTPPLDSIIKIEQKKQPDIYIHSSLMALASIGLILAFIFLFINIKYASHRYIKMSSPKMNNIILVGCILVYSSIYLIRLDPTVVTSTAVLRVVCVVRHWILLFGFSLAFGPLFAKTWRIYMIFHSPQRKNKLITDRMLLALVATLLVMDLIILISWSLIHPLRIVSVQLTPIDEENRIINVVIFKCVSDRMDIWAATIYVYKGLLLVVGCFFAWQTRHVNIPALNDSKYIGLSVYNVVIMCTSAVAVSYVVKSEQDYCDLITGILTIACTTITLCLVFVPKIMHLIKDPQGASPRPRLTCKHKSLSKGSMLTKQCTVEEFTTTELKVAQLEQEVASNALLLAKTKDRHDQLIAKSKRKNLFSISSLAFAATIVENVSVSTPGGQKGTQTKV